MNILRAARASRSGRDDDRCDAAYWINRYTFLVHLLLLVEVDDFDVLRDRVCHKLDELGLLDSQRIEVLARAELELGDLVAVLLNLHPLGVSAVCEFEELTRCWNRLRHLVERPAMAVLTLVLSLDNDTQDMIKTPPDVSFSTRRNLAGFIVHNTFGIISPCHASQSGSLPSSFLCQAYCEWSRLKQTCPDSPMRKRKSMRR